MNQHVAGGAPEWHASFIASLPLRPFCSNHYVIRSKPRPRDEAIEYSLIQLNETGVTVYLTADLDYKGAAEAAENGNVAMPNLIMENPSNGHAHLAWQLAAPVTHYKKSRHTPVTFLADIERGLTRRLNGDLAYGGHLTKNPLSKSWRVTYRAGAYTLAELDRWLEAEDKKPWAPGARETGLGRNASLFDALRRFAYKEVLRFKREELGRVAYYNRLLTVAGALNREMTFSTPLPSSEVAGIVRSVGGWTWRKFSPECYDRIQRARSSSELQRVRIQKRWAGHVSAESIRPWETEGISRATWYARRRNA